MTEAVLVERMSRAARTSLFDAVCDPDLLIGIILSNLMSPALWKFCDKIKQKVDEQSPDERQALMKTISHYVNSHFFHLRQREVRDIWGLVDIDSEATGPRQVPIMHAIDLILTHSAARYSEERQILAPLVEKGVFPEYLYNTLDITRANRQVLKHKKHKPYGITNCADEAILISSLAYGLGGAEIDDIIIIGSPMHYTAFVGHGDHAVWFNGKSEFFDKENWDQEVKTTAGGNPQAAFDNRLLSLERIITPRGTFVFSNDHNSIASDCWQSIRAALAKFFGTELKQITEACSRDVTVSHHPLSNVSFADLDTAQSADDATTVLEGLATAYPGTALETAAYTFRRLDVCHRQAYVVAALREHRTREAAADVTCVEDAVAIVQGIEHDASILGHDDRIALPDEVLLLNMGTSRDKALLLYTLLHHAGGDVTPQELILTTKDSYVRIADHLIGLTTFEVQEEIAGDVLFCYA